MNIPPLAAKVLAFRNVVGAAVVIGGVVISALGMLKVPAQNAEIAQKLSEHNQSSLDVQSETNKKLDVLICLQAKLDTPIRCVAKK